MLHSSFLTLRVSFQWKDAIESGFTRSEQPFLAAEIAESADVCQSEGKAE